MKNFSIQAKLAIALGSLATLLALVSGLALHLLSNERRNFDTFVNETHARVALTSRILEASQDRAIAARNMVLAMSPDQLAEAKAAAVRAHEQVGKAHTQMEQLLNTADTVDPEERRLYAALAQIEREYGPVALGVVALSSEGRRDDATAKMNQTCSPLLARLIQAAEAYGTWSEHHAAEAAAIAHQQSRVASNILTAASIGGVAGAALLAWLLTRAIVTPITQAVAVAQRVAQGDLTAAIVVDRRDETGDLLAALRDMTGNLIALASRVRDGSDRIAAGSQEIASGNIDLSHRTESQASRLQQTTSAMSEMTTALQSSGQTAREACSMAQEARSSAQQGELVMRDVVTTMSQISASARKVSEIIGTIDGIAFQTNILALNASVEAARAGEQGRGFSVVASEVRALAQRSASAAKEIKTLIQESVNSVETGSRQVLSAGTSMSTIVEQVEKVSVLISDISHNAVHQASGIEQVNGAIHDLDHATQQNAALVEQSAAAAESLRDQAQALATAAAAFKLPTAA